ncbi:MAG: hypothetical protein KDK33_04195 [Leptospiraceae bacterium]|nr:hypothetical protein [Leptospiraceae bacterium]
MMVSRIRNSFASLLILASCATASALELPRSTKDYTNLAAFVAVVEVEGVVAAPGGANLLQYRVQVLDNLKGSLPSVIDIRILTASKIIQPSPYADAPGQKWLVILGNRTGQGFYPLKSMNWGKIELLEDENGELWLARSVTGFGAQYENRRLSLTEFKRLLSR